MVILGFLGYQDNDNCLLGQFESLFLVSQFFKFIIRTRDMTTIPQVASVVVGGGDGTPFFTTKKVK